MTRPAVPRDEVTIDRLIAGERPPHHRPERIEAMRRMLLTHRLPRRIIAERLGISLGAARRACCRITAQQRRHGGGDG